jgi:hypothetical protein
MLSFKNQKIMLTEKDYNNLWEKHFSQFNKLEMPSYQEYVEREKLFEEYLTHIPSSGIKYILVAEAAPFHDKSKTEVGAYFYNYSNVAGLATPYFRAPCDLFNISRTPLTIDTAKNALYELAKEGVLLLDLFPFALNIDSHLRKKIAGRGILKHFWDGDHYSIKTQIKDLCSKQKIKLDDQWDLCLIAPPLISCHLVGAYDALIVAPCTNGLHNNSSFKAISPNILRGCDHKKVAVDTSGSPNAQLIREAFDLKKAIIKNRKK